jgi:hypothetical protein
MPIECGAGSRPFCDKFLGILKNEYFYIFPSFYSRGGDYMPLSSKKGRENT